MSILRRTVRGLHFALLLICCGPCYIAEDLYKSSRSGPRSYPIVYPPPLPTKRIDISKRTAVNNPGIPPWRSHNTPAASRTTPDWLLCLYLEGLPILHRKNTYMFNISDFPQLFLGGLGMYCISNIRHLCLELVVEPDSYRFAGALVLERAVELLHAMQLETLHITIQPLDGDLATRILTIRGLRAFEVEFLEDDPWKTEQRQLAMQLVDEYRALMVGPEAEERYLAYLKDRAEHRAVVP
uniref:Uncharacterized protein n=1 Tax=Mycena chlorophos TaxID=658473 RepID=A0ABQ0L6N7_MYCCL|nr:predicted protein [Mycena chlorophos]